MNGPLHPEPGNHARLNPLTRNAAILRPGFWSDILRINRERALPHGLEKIRESGVLENFQSVIDGKQGPANHTGMVFADSDAYKWIEAVSWDGARTGEPTCAHELEQMVDRICRAQEPDGYVNTAIQTGKPAADRWRDLSNAHELYCAGHLIQAAIAHRRSLGSDDLFACALRFADRIVEDFTRQKRRGVAGHPLIEMAMVELFRETGETAYLETADYLVMNRGKGWIGGDPYHQDDAPPFEAPTMRGHAVRQLYLLSGMTDLYLHRGNPGQLENLERLWEDMASTKISISGGLGARYDYEAFGEAFELPTDRNYDETCAQIAGFQWNWRMLLATGNPRYADLMEWTLYNGILSGTSLDQRRYFYPNPLLSRGSVERQPWFGCACCPPNLMRTFASLDGYFATGDNQSLQIHLFGNLGIQWKGVQLEMKSAYPFDGAISIHFMHPGEKALELAFRIPAWAKRPHVIVNGRQTVNPEPGTYCRLREVWTRESSIEIQFNAQPGIHYPHPRLEMMRHCVAVSKGPLLYCLESADLEDGRDALDAVLPEGAVMDSATGPEGLGTADSLVVHGGFRCGAASHSSTPLYSRQPWSEKIEPGILRLIPYYVWANRGRHSMRVWIPTSPLTSAPHE